MDIFERGRIYYRWCQSLPLLINHLYEQRLPRHRGIHLHRGGYPAAGLVGQWRAVYTPGGDLGPDELVILLGKVAREHVVGGCRGTREASGLGIGMRMRKYCQ